MKLKMTQPRMARNREKCVFSQVQLINGKHPSLNADMRFAARQFLGGLKGET